MKPSRNHNKQTWIKTDLLDREDLVTVQISDNEIVQMFRLPDPRGEIHFFPRNQKVTRSNGIGRILDERFIRILRIFKWGPDAERAVEVLKLKVDQKLVCQVLNVDVGANVKLHFFKWAGKRRNFQHDATTYMALINCLGKAGLADEMLRTIHEMVRNSCIIQPSELFDIVNILGRAKMVNKAISIFYQIKGRKCKPTVSTYNSIFFMLMQENNYEKIYELYTEMCKDGTCIPDTVTYSVLISTLGKLDRADSAIRLFEEMRVNGLQPTAKSYTTLLGIYFKLGCIDQALGLVQEMRDKNWPPTVYTYTEIIKGLGKAGRTDEACDVFQKMLKERCKPDVVLMNNFINILGRAGRGGCLMQ